MQSHQPTVGELFADRYQIEKVLGKGGMGQVYLAQDSLLEGTEVALKILSPQLTRDASYLKQFLREIQLARQVTHPNVARTFEAGTYQNQLFFVMELVKGGELGQLLGRGGMPIAHALPIIIQICEGLIAIHDIGVVHGDLKPANLMLACDGMVKITDFGIARSQAQKSGGEIVGSPHYMAPELWRGEGNSARSDLYALGIIIYEIVTGRGPFEGENDTNSMYHHLATAPQRPMEVKSSIPEWMDKLIMDLINKDARQRPKSAKAVREIIDEAVNGPKDGPTYIIEVNHDSVAASAGAASSSVLNSDLPEQDTAGQGRVNNSIDNLQRSMMYDANALDDSSSTRFFNWVASLDQEFVRNCMVRGAEAVLASAISAWLLLYPLNGLNESVVGAAQRSESNSVTIASILFIFLAVSALLNTPLLLIGRAFLTRIQTVILWITATAAATVLLSILCCVHLKIYSRLVDPNGLTAFTQKALHSMRNVTAGSIQAALLVPFNGLSSVALQSGFIEPSLDSTSMSLLFSVAIVLFYVLLGGLIHLLILRPHGKHIRNWRISLPAIIPALIAAESCCASIFPVEKLERFTLPWIATIQQSFPRPMILLALLNWAAVFAYLLLLMRPAQDESMPWEKQKPGFVND